MNSSLCIFIPLRGDLVLQTVESFAPRKFLAEVTINDTDGLGDGAIQ